MRSRAARLRVAAAGALLAFTLLTGCGGGAPPPPATDAAQAPGDTLYRSGPSPAGQGPPGGQVEAGARPGPTPVSQLVAGYRVQILTTPSLALAEAARERAGDLLGVFAYVEYRSPAYRVRLGDFATAGAAADLLTRALDVGYAGASVVPTLVDERRAKE